MGFQQNGTYRNRYGSSRPYQTRSTLPVVVIVCDDTKTAISYFDVIKREVKAKVTVTIVNAPCDGATADMVVSLAIKAADDLKSARSHDPEDATETIWALIDLEAEPEKQASARLARGKALSHGGVSVSLSNPCFEVWTLAHLIDTGEAFNNCKAVLDRIKVEWKKKFGSAFEKKAQADYQKLMQYRSDAIQRAKKRSERKDPSWTEVWKVVEAILSMAS